MDTTRISGLASNMDTETMVKNLMKVERAKVDKLNQSKQIALWKQEQYNTVNKDYANFILDTKKELELTKTTSSGVLLNNSISNLSWVKKGSSSDEDIFTVKTTATAMTGNHKVKIKKMADGVNIVGESSVKLAADNTTQATKTTTLSQLGLTDGSITFETSEKDEEDNYKTITINYEATDTIDKLLKKINSAKTDDGDATTAETSLGIQANFDSTSGRLFLATKKTGEDAKIKVTADENGLLTGAGNIFNMAGSTTLVNNAASTSEVKADATGDTTLSELGIADGKIKLKIDGVDKEISFLGTDTITAFVGKLNTAGLDSASFDNATKKLTLDTGDKAIIVTEDTQKLFSGFNNKFKMTGVSNSAGLLNENKGIDAVIDFDGATNLKYSSNNIIINGIQIDLKAVPTNTDDEFTLKVDTDVDSVYDKIKTFVDKYNEIVGKLNTKVSEKRYRQYTPLTSEQKEAMKEDDVKLWEQKAKSGLLRNDEFLSRTMQTSRSGLYEDVEGVVGNYTQLSTIGVTTGKWEEKGKLVIDEKKLRNSIIDDVDGVLDLLFKEPTTEEKTTIDEKLKTELEEKNKIKYEDFDVDQKAEYKRELNKRIRSNTGVVNRLFDDITIGMKEIINKSGPGDDKELYRSVKSDILIDFITGGNGRKGSISILDEDVLDYEKRIKSEEDRLINVEERYWNKFTAMEKALSQMQSQSSWIAQQMGGQ